MSAIWNNMWTPISEDNLRGWVKTHDEAENIRKIFQAQNALIFIVDRKGKFGRGLRLERPVRCSTDTGPGGGSGRDSVVRKTRSRIRFRNVGEEVVPYDGVPFVISARCTLSCIYGKDKHTSSKRRYQERKQPNKRRYNRQKPTQKMGCPAKIHIIEVIRFPDFEVKSHKEYSRKSARGLVHEALICKEKLRTEQRVYIRLPSDADHQNLHEIGEPVVSITPKAKRRRKKMEATQHVTLQTIEEAAERVKGHIHRTPVMTCGMLDRMAPGRNLFFKCELLQKTGSFKIRGALNAVSKLMEASPDAVGLKVITHSSGNFGQALAYAAQLKGLDSFVVMPNIAPLCKINAVLGYGATVVKCNPTEQSREEIGHIMQKETGAHFCSSSQSHDVISGQGTIGLELLEQIPDLDAVVVPVGGGGMIAGIATAIKSKNPNIKVYAAEPCNADDCSKSFLSKRLTPLPPGPVDTVADGLRVSIGESTWPIIANYVDDVITVTEDEIKDATRAVWQYLKQFIEPSAGVGVAAVLSQKFSLLPPEINNVAVILCGGNVDLDAVKHWM